MEKYIEQLLGDIAHATQNVSLPYLEKDLMNGKKFAISPNIYS